MDLKSILVYVLEKISIKMQHPDLRHRFRLMFVRLYSVSIIKQRKGKRLNNQIGREREKKKNTNRFFQRTKIITKQ